MGQSFQEIADDAVELTRDEFVAKHGEELVYVWDNTQNPPVEEEPSE